MIMPGALSGRDLAEALLAKKSELKIIYTSGYSPEITNGKMKLQEHVNFLPKPYHPQKLLQLIRCSLDSSAMAA